MRFSNKISQIYDISCATATECYATGGKLSELAGWFLYTNNAGASWTKVENTEILQNLIQVIQLNKM